MHGLQVMLLTPQDVAMISWACARVGHRDPLLAILLGDKVREGVTRGVTGEGPPLDPHI